MTTYDKALNSFTPVHAAPISLAELHARITALQGQMAAAGIKALWLDASSSLRYYTGLSIGPSERMHGALIPVQGRPIYVSPVFEVPKLNTMVQIAGDILGWEEHEDPCAMVVARLRGLDLPGTVLALDPATPYLFAARLIAGTEGHVVPAAPLISAQRQVKSAAEIAIIQTAMTASWHIQKAVWQGLHVGVSTTEICQFVDEAHRRCGMEPLFVAAQFGGTTAYPHGRPGAQHLADGDMVLIDLGGILEGYRSDITRTYMFGTPTDRQAYVWDCERRAHLAAFDAAKIGAPCEAVDAAARAVLTAEGFGPDYQVPGLPHRTGHGLGMDIHEDPFMVRGNATPLAPGMVFSIEPMLCVYGECGVRLEDIVWMGEDGPHWFCPPATSCVTPF